MNRGIGKKIKNLRLKKGLTQEELGERTDLTKGYISQIERDLSSPSIDTFFSILEVLGCTPKEFFDDFDMNQKVVYDENDRTEYTDEDYGYKIEWLVPDSNEHEMEPILLTLWPEGKFKEYEPSLPDTFAYVIEGQITVNLGRNVYPAKTGDTVYFQASSEHQIMNDFDGISKILLVATESYL